jgi:phosphoribosylformylglycinamidine cyclo-ligase
VSRRAAVDGPEEVGSMPSLTEDAVGVRSVGSGLAALLRWIRPTFDLAPGARPVLDIGYFANVVPVSDTLGIAISTDGVGTKLLVAEAAGKFDSVGIDCVAMNVNDVLCVGARPVALVDYIAVEEADPELLGPLGQGIALGCEQAGVSCPGGELAQVREMIRGGASTWSAPRSAPYRSTVC